MRDLTFDGIVRRYLADDSMHLRVHRMMHNHWLAAQLHWWYKIA